MHAKSRVYRHTLKESFASAAHLDKVADMVFARELLDAWDEPGYIWRRQEMVHRHVYVRMYVIVFLGVLDESLERGGGHLWVFRPRREVVRVNDLDRFLRDVCGI